MCTGDACKNILGAPNSRSNCWAKNPTCIARPICRQHYAMAWPWRARLQGCTLKKRDKNDKTSKQQGRKSGFSVKSCASLQSGMPAWNIQNVVKQCVIAVGGPLQLCRLSWSLQAWNRNLLAVSQSRTWTGLREHNSSRNPAGVPFCCSKIGTN